MSCERTRGILPDRARAPAGKFPQSLRSFGMTAAAEPAVPRAIFSSPMARLLTPKFLLRGFEISVLASLAGFGVTLLYGNDLPAFLRGLEIGRAHV